MSNAHRLGNGTTQACAACKYQRRKCAPDCILAPYFPHDKQRQFLNAHKLFGVSNITKIIKNLSQSAKDDAMSTIIFQSDVRASDPVGGCYRIVRELQRQIEYTKAELNIVLHQLAICRAQAAQVQALPQTMVHPDPMGTFCGVQYDCVSEPQQQYVAVQSESSNLVQDFNGWGLQDSSSSCCDEIKPLLEINGDDHFKFGGDDAEEILDRRGEAILRVDSALLKEDGDSIPQAQPHQDHDLKSAATLFTLTNCNS